MDQSLRATRKGNAKLFSMTKATVASIAYVAMQVFQSLLYFQASSEHDNVGSLCIIISRGLYLERWGNKLTGVLQEPLDISSDSWGEGRSWTFITILEPVRIIDRILSNDSFHLLMNSQIFPNYSTSRIPITQNSALMQLQQHRKAKIGRSWINLYFSLNNELLIWFQDIFRTNELS